MTEVGHPTEASATLLRAVRTGDRETARELWKVFADYDSSELAGALSDDAHTAFWLNVYNAAVQDELRTDRAGTTRAFGSSPAIVSPSRVTN